MKDDSLEADYLIWMWATNIYFAVQAVDMKKIKMIYNITRQDGNGELWKK